MPKYHINPTTGNTGVCHAKKSCPFGDMESDHYPSKEAARLGYEKQNATVTTPSPIVYPRGIPLSNAQKQAIASKLKYLGPNASFIIDREEEHDEHLFVSFYTTVGGAAELAGDEVLSSNGQWE
jgi:hypothetical protein